MVKTAADVRQTARQLAEALGPVLKIERILLATPESVDENQASDVIPLVVISRDFEGIAVPDRIGMIAPTARQVDWMIVAFGFTPWEIAGKPSLPVVGILTQGSEVVYERAESA